MRAPSGSTKGWVTTVLLLCLSVPTLAAVPTSGADAATRVFPDTFAVPAPHFGDVFEYAVRLEAPPGGPDATGKDLEGALHVEWGASGWFYDAVGTPRWAAEITVTPLADLPGFGDRPTTHVVELETGAVVARRSLISGKPFVPAVAAPPEEASNGDGKNPLAGEYERSTLLFAIPGEEELTAPCGLFHGLQRNAWTPSAAPSDVFGDCTFGPFAHSGAPYAAVGLARLGDRRLLEFERRPAAPEDGTRVRAWFAEDIPFALRLEVRDGPHAATFRMTGFRGGTSPYEAPPVPALAPLAALELEPRRPWGPDDRGTSHPFPLSAAYQEVLENPLDARLRTFVEAHPDATVFDARFSEHVQTDTHRVRRHWEFAVGAGADSARFCVLEETWGSPVPPADSLMENGTLRRIEFPTCYRAAPREVPRVPEALPSVASLWRRWQAHASPPFLQAGANGWGLETMCPNPECTGGGLRLTAGHQAYAARRGLDPEDSEVDESRMRASRIEVDALGRVRALREHETHSAINLTRPSPLGGDAETSDAEPLFPVRGTHVEPWTVPAVVLAGVGLAALASLLYWVWPLFAKLTPERVLAHPRRSRILQLVRARPGVPTITISRELHLSWSKTVYHLRVLERAGQLRTRRVDGQTAHFLPGSVAPRQEEPIALLRRTSLRRVVDLLESRPGLDQAAIAQALDLGQPRVSKALQRLERAGLVARERHGRRNAYSVVEGLRDLGRLASTRGDEGPRADPPLSPSGN